MFRLSRQVSPDGFTYTFARDKLPTLFYADVSPEDRYKGMERLRPQPLSISTTPMTLTEDRFGSVPRWYIECTHDNAVRIKLQRADGQDDAVQGHHHGMRPLALLQQRRGVGRAPRGDRTVVVANAIKAAYICATRPKA